jgi:hypothetical protein
MIYHKVLTTYPFLTIRQKADKKYLPPVVNPEEIRYAGTRVIILQSHPVSLIAVSVQKGKF